MPFFTEREGQLPPPTNTEIPPQFVEAIASELVGLADRGWLARGWPAKCQDDSAVIIGTDSEKFWHAARTKLNFSATTAADLANEPNPLVVLNLIEFVYEHVAYPIVVKTHPHFSHNHLDFNGAHGKATFLTEVNELFGRYGLAYELTAQGTVIRLAPEEIQSKLIDALYVTGDAVLDELLNTARKKYLNPNPTTRREGLEKLWDAFERLKTITVGPDKKAQIAALLQAAYTETDARTRFNTEFGELTAIGNAYNIRHFETNKLPIPDDAFVDWLFARCYSAIHAVLDKTGGVKH